MQIFLILDTNVLAKISSNSTNYEIIKENRINLEINNNAASEKNKITNFYIELLINICDLII